MLPNNRESDLWTFTLDLQQEGANIAIMAMSKAVTASQAEQRVICAVARNYSVMMLAVMVRMRRGIVIVIAMNDVQAVMVMVLGG